MDKQLNVSITTSTLLKALLICGGVWLVYHLRELVLVLVTAVVLASAMEPLAAAFARKRVPRILAVLLVYLIFFGFIFGLFYFFLPSLLSDAAGFVSSLPVYLETFGRAGAFDEFASSLGVTAVPSISPDVILDQLRGYVSSISANVFSAVSAIFGGVLSFMLIIVFSFYFTVQETGVDDFLRVIVPSKHQKYALGLWRRSQRKIGLWMQGQLLLGVIMGVLVYLILTILGVPHALILAVLAGVFELIPVFGPILAAVPAVAVAFAAGGGPLGLIVICVYILLQQFENHLIYPLVVTKVVGVPPLLVILALIIGAELAGFLGILLSVPIAATIQELVKDLEESRRVELAESA